MAWFALTAVIKTELLVAVCVQLSRNVSLRQVLCAGSDLWERRGEILVGSCPLGLPIGLRLWHDGTWNVLPSTGASMSQKNSDKQHQLKGARDKENTLNWNQMVQRQQRSMESLWNTHSQRGGNSPLFLLGPLSPEAGQEYHFPKLQSPQVWERWQGRFGIFITNCRPVWGCEYSMTCVLALSAVPRK